MATNTPQIGLPPRVLREAAIMLRALAHPLRLRIVEQLMAGEQTVGQLIYAVGGKQHIVSQHLRELRRVNVVTGRRSGRFVHYRLINPDAAGVIITLRRHHFTTDTITDGAAI